MNTKTIIPRDKAVELLMELPKETAVRSYRLPPVGEFDGHLMLCVDLEKVEEVEG